jgi:hypothetical protein
MWNTLVKDKELYDWSYAELAEELNKGELRRKESKLDPQQETRLLEILHHMQGRPESSNKSA